jgi:hypothetical protein
MESTKGLKIGEKLIESFHSITPEDPAELKFFRVWMEGIREADYKLNKTVFQSCIKIDASFKATMETPLRTKKKVEKLDLFISSNNLHSHKLFSLARKGENLTTFAIFDIPAGEIEIIKGAYCSESRKKEPIPRSGYFVMTESKEEVEPKVFIGDELDTYIGDDSHLKTLKEEMLSLRDLSCPATH